MPKFDYSSSILPDLIRERILLLDGAMGTMIQRLSLDERAVRGDRFEAHSKDLRNFPDILCLTHPEKITDIHLAYLEAGSDIIETNTFGASPIGMLEYELPVSLVNEINRAAVDCARKAIEMSAKRSPNRPRFVAGSIGPTTRQMAISVDPNDASKRSTSFPEMVDSYRVQVASLVSAGVDILLPETAIDTLNLKACLFAIQDYFDQGGRRVPVMVSGTFDRGGRTFVSGQSIEAFVAAVEHFPLLTIGMNCALGPDIMRQHIEELAKVSSSLLTDQGQAYFLIPAYASVRFKNIFEANQLFISRQCLITNFLHTNPFRIILELRRGKQDIITDHLTIYEVPGTYTRRTLELLEPYYLYL